MSGSILSSCEGCGAAVFASYRPPAPMVHAQGCPLADRQPCDWCGGPMRERPRPGAECCQDRCRAARWTWRRRYGAQRPARNRRNGKSGGRSGRQVPFRRAVHVLADALTALEAVPVTREDALKVAEGILREALPPRQRARLDHRSPA